MRKTTKMKLSAILGAAAFLFVGGAFLATNETKATAEDATPTLTFKAGNVNFGDDVHTLFAVDAQNVGEAEVKVLLWNSAQAEYTVEAAEIILDDQGTVDINETTCLKYTYEGLGAHEMTKNLYARAYAVVDGVACYSDPLKYSVLQYAYNKMGKTDATASTNQDYIDLLQAMLNYGGAVQTYTNQNTDRLASADYTYVKLTNAKFEDGFTKGLYLPSEEVKIIPEEGYKLSINADSAFKKNDDGTVTLKVPNRNVITEDDVFIDQDVEENEEAKTLATFEFGPNGDAAHVDGSNLGTSKTYTDGNYELSLTAMSSVFGPAYDEKGNSCIKLGTSSKTGSFEFTVPDEVTEVVLYIAGYKATAAKISINSGDTQTISTSLSDNGEYTAIKVDTSTNKTIKFTTLSESKGYRAMLNTVEFIGIEK